MIKLPTVKVNGQTASIINRHQVEDDIAVAEAISRDAARWRWMREHWDCDDGAVNVVGYTSVAEAEKFIDERI